MVSDDHGHDVRRDLVAAGGGSNQPPGVQIGYITAFPGSFELLGNVADPDEPGSVCGQQYCVQAKTAGACGAVAYFSCTCLAGLEVDILKTATSGICTVTFTLKDSWGQIGTPSFSFDVSTGRPALGSSSAAPASALPGGQR
jgi:hypothetical protein